MVRQQTFLNDIVDLYILRFTLQAWGNMMDRLDPYLSFGSDSQETTGLMSLGCACKLLSPCFTYKGVKAFWKYFSKDGFKIQRFKITKVTEWDIRAKPRYLSCYCCWLAASYFQDSPCKALSSLCWSRGCMPMIFPEVTPWAWESQDRLSPRDWEHAEFLLWRIIDLCSNSGVWV